MKKSIIWIVLTACLLSCTAFPIFAAETVESASGTVVLGDETVETVLLDKDKIYAKEYTREELEAYVNSQLARDHVMGNLLVTCYTDDIEETKTVISQILDTVAPYEYESHVSIKELVTYVFIGDEAEMHASMLALLEEGYDATVNGVAFDPLEEIPEEEKPVEDEKVYITIDGGDGVILWDPEEPPCTPLDEEKVQKKEYTQEELSAFVSASLSQARMEGELYIWYTTDDADAAAAELREQFDLQITNVTAFTNFAFYVAEVEEARMAEKMLELLLAGINVSASYVGFAEECAPFRCGDIDTSGEVDATDYMMVKRMVLGTHTVSNERAKLADIDGDGEINVADYMMVKRHVLGTFEITRGAIIDWINS